MIPAYALYRRSTTAQDLSIEQQRDAVQRWATEHGYEIVREFADDASGLDTARRREFLALLSVCGDASTRVADVVLCYDVSRFSRLEPDEAAFHEFSLKRAGVRVVYTHEPGANDDGAAGHLVKTLKRVLAHEHSQKLSQLVRRGQRDHAAHGLWTGGRAPFGYRRAIRRPDGTLTVLADGQRAGKSDDVVLAVDPVEAQIVRDIFEAHVQRGRGLRAVAEWLNARGVPPPSSLRRVGGLPAWAKSTVLHILRSPIYGGRLVYGRAAYRDVGVKRGKRRTPDAEHVVTEHPSLAIVSEGLWTAAQAACRKFGVGRPRAHYLLSGLIVCASCGKHYQAQRQERGRIPAVYVCGGYVASGATYCAGARIPTSYLDDAILDGIQKRLDRLLDRDELARRLRDALGADTTISRPDELDARLRDTRQRIGRLVEALAAGDGDLPSVRAALVALERNRQALEREAARARATRNTGDVEDVVAELIDGLTSARALLEAGDHAERKALARTFVKEIRIEQTKRRAIVRWYRMPRASYVGMVAVGGIEPPTRGL